MSTGLLAFHNGGQRPEGYRHVLQRPVLVAKLPARLESLLQSEVVERPRRQKAVKRRMVTTGKRSERSKPDASSGVSCSS